MRRSLRRLIAVPAVGPLFFLWIPPGLQPRQWGAPTVAQFPGTPRSRPYNFSSTTCVSTGARAPPPNTANAAFTVSSPP